MLARIIPSMLDCAFRIAVEVSIGKFVSVLEPAIVIAVLLDCIISEVDELISKVIKRKLFATGPQIAIFVEITLHLSILCDQHAIDSDVKLAFMNKKWVFNVALNY